MQRVQAGSSLSGQKTKAMLQTLRQDESLWPAVLVFFGTLFLLFMFTFYHPVLIFLLAGVSAAIAYKMPQLGTILGIALAFPAIAYQSPIFAWLYMMVLALALFEAWTHWYIISFLQIIICAPFAPFPLSVLGGFVQFGLTLGALRAGSRESILISIPSVLLILLLSTLWLTPNSAFMLTLPLSDGSIYAPANELLQRNSLPEPELPALPIALVDGFGRMFSWDVIMQVSPAIEKVFGNLLKLLLQDSAILQLVAWTGVLYLIGFLPGHTKSLHKQFMAGSILLLIPLTHWLISIIYSIEFPLEIIAYSLVSVALVGVLEHYNFQISRERFIMRSKKANSFGDLAEDMGGSDKTISFAGYEDVKRELKEAFMPMLKPEINIAYDIQPPHGILLFGPPGTGKTFLIKYLAQEMDMGVYYVKCSKLLSEWYGQSEKQVAMVFAEARRNSPCILFFDELDWIGKKRDSYASDDVAPRVLSQLLMEIDGFTQKQSKPVIIIGATNAPDSLDNALIRPGRLDKIIYMPLPDAKAREAVLKVHAAKVPISEDVDFAKLAKMTERFSGADLTNVVTEATRLAAREAVTKDVIIPVSMKHFLATLKGMRPSVGLEALENYERFRLDFERRSGGTAGSIEQEQKETTAVKWNDVIGLDSVRKTLLEAIEIPLLHDDLMKKYKVKPAKGLLLFGPPGCGKTMIVRAASSELEATFLSVSGADLTRKGPENAVRMLKETFNRAREQPPALIFIDEIEALAPSRSNYSSPILTQLLQELDGVKELKNVMLIGATNKPSQIDNALLRPGRFDKILYIPPPDAKGRAALFARQLSDVAPGVNAGLLSSMAKGYSGADITAICQEAKMKLVRSSIAGKAEELATEDVVAILAQRKPSISDSDLADYEAFVHTYGERR